MTKLLERLDLFSAGEGVGKTPPATTVRSVNVRHPEFGPMTPVRTAASVCPPMSKRKGVEAMPQSQQFDLPFAKADEAVDTAATRASGEGEVMSTGGQAVVAARTAGHHPPDALDRLIAGAPHGNDRPPNLEACLAYLATQPDRPRTLLGEARSAVSTLAKMLNRTAESFPADPVLLRPILAGINWAAWGMSQKREANIRSALTGLLLPCGWVAPVFRAKARYSPEWRALMTLAEPHKLSGPLGPFGRFCAARGVGPQQVNNDHLLAYLETLEAASLHLHPRHCAAKVSHAWKRMSPKEPAWPQVMLGLPSEVEWKACRIGDLPQRFQAELPAYLESLRRPNPLDKDASREMKEISVQHARRAILRAVAYLIESGHKKIEGIDQLAVLVEPAALHALLLAAHADGGDAWSFASVLIVGQLMNLARRWVKPAPEVMAELKDMRSMVKVPK